MDEHTRSLEASQSSASTPSIRLLAPPRTEDQIVLPAQPTATGLEVKGATNSCVVHLCGCDA